jgi:hypothetical protein
LHNLAVAKDYAANCAIVLDNDIFNGRWEQGHLAFI